MKGKLILEDGSVFNGELLHEACATGEVVFNTGMTGYQEILTDPSYCGQIVTLTYPLIGNYGVAELFNQSRQPFVKGFVIGELCTAPSNWQKTGDLSTYLIENKIPCIYGVDTRAITRKIRSVGTMKGIIVKADVTEDEIKELMEDIKNYGEIFKADISTIYALKISPYLALRPYNIIPQNVKTTFSKILFS